MGEGPGRPPPTQPSRQTVEAPDYSAVPREPAPRSSPHLLLPRGRDGSTHAHPSPAPAAQVQVSTARRPRPRTGPSGHPATPPLLGHGDIGRPHPHPVSSWMASARGEAGTWGGAQQGPQPRAAETLVEGRGRQRRSAGRWAACAQRWASAHRHLCPSPARASCSLARSLGTGSSRPARPAWRSLCSSHPSPARRPGEGPTLHTL